MPIDLNGDVAVAPPVLPAVRVAPPASPTVTALPVAGPPGPEGPPGSSADNYYVHTQAVASATWIINHNLGKNVQVSIFDSTSAPWRLVYTDVEHGSLNQTTVIFPSPVTGSAVIS